MKLIDEIEKSIMKKRKFPSFRAGDTIRVMVRVKEGDKERLQPFEGVVIRFRRSGLKTTFTMRKVSYGVGVERIFPFYSPVIASIEVKSRGSVSKSRIYYLRKRSGKAARIEEGDQVGPADLDQESEPAVVAGVMGPGEGGVPAGEKEIEKAALAEEKEDEKEIPKKAAVSQEAR